MALKDILDSFVALPDAADNGRVDYSITADTQRDLYAFALEQAPFGVCFVAPDGTPLMVNRQLTLWFDTPLSQLMNQQVGHFVHEDDRHLFMRAINRVSNGGRSYRHIEVRLKSQSHRTPAWVAVSMSRLSPTQGGNVVVYMADISNRKQTEAEWMQRATKDHLTGLGNRMVFDETLEAIRKKVRRYSCQAAILYIDLDEFKQINDNYGHKAGDAILQEVGTVLQNQLRETDVVARIGGDEFAAIMYEVGEDEANEKAQAISAAITQIRVEAHGKKVGVGASVGVHIFTGEETDLQDIIAAADKAMYQSKSESKKKRKLHA